MNPRVDSPWCWFIAFSGFTLQATLWGVTLSFGIFYVALLKDFPGQESETAWIVSINMGLVMLITPLTIRLCRRLSPQVVCCTGVLLASLALCLSSIAPNLPTLYATFGVLHGVATSFTFLAAILVIRTNFKKHLDFALAINNTGTGVGGIVYGLTLPSLVESRGWRGAFKILSCVMLPLIICGLVLVPIVQKNEPVVKLKKTSPTNSLPKKTWLKAIRIPVPSTWRNKAFIVLCGAIILAGFVTPIPYCHIVNYAIDQGLGRSDADRLPLFIAIGSTVGRLSIGKVSGFRILSRITLCQITFLVLAFATTLCTLATTFMSQIAFAVIFGAFDGGFALLVALVVDDVFSDQCQATKALGSLFSVLSLPFMLASPLAGWLYTVTGSYHTIFFCCGCILFVATCLVSLVRYFLSSPHLDLIQVNSSSPKLRRLNSSTRVLSLLDLSAESYALSTETNIDASSRKCSGKFLLVPSDQTVSFQEQVRVCIHYSKDRMTEYDLPRECLYTDITDQISGALSVDKDPDNLSERENYVSNVKDVEHQRLVVDEKERRFSDVKSSLPEEPNDVTGISDVINTSVGHVCNTCSSHDVKCFVSCVDVVMEDQGYASAGGVASFEDHDVGILWNENSDSNYSSLDSSLSDVLQEEDRKINQCFAGNVSWREGEEFTESRLPDKVVHKVGEELNRCL